MTEDDVSADAAAATARRAPRFSWTSDYELTFFQSLCESVNLGLRDNNTFKPEAWERALIALRDKHGAIAAKSHLINKADNARKRFRLWRGLREDPNFEYDPITHTVNGSEDNWREHLQKEPLARSLKGRPFEHEAYMKILYPDVIGSGGVPKRIMKPKRRTGDDASPTGDDAGDMPGTSVMFLPPETGPFGLVQPTDVLQAQTQQTPQTQLGLLGTQPTMTLPSHTQTQLQQMQQLQQQQQFLQSQPLQSQHQARPVRAHPRTTISTTVAPNAPLHVTTSALTPPDDAASSQGRKRQLSISNGVDARGSMTLTTPNSSTTPTSGTLTLASNAVQQPAMKRRRSAAVPKPPTTASSSFAASSLMVAAPTNNAPNSTPPTPSVGGAAGTIERLLRENQGMLEQINCLLQARTAATRWSEQAIDIFLRDFSNEDMDLQIKIAEKVLADESKAMVFVKFTPELREHWVKRLREVINNRPPP